MSGEAPITPNVAPASAEAPVKMASADMQYKVVVDGREMLVPVAELAKTRQLSDATEKRLEGAKKMQAEYRQQIELVQHLENVRATRGAPAAVAEFQKIVGYTGGNTSRQGAEDSIADAPQDAPTSALQAELQQVQGQLRELTSFKQAFTTEREQQQIMGRIRALPLYQEDAKLADRAAMTVGAMRVTYPDRPVDEVIAEIHAMDAEALTNHTNRLRDTRNGRAAATRGVSPAIGSPALTTPPKLTYADFEQSRKTQQGPFAQAWASMQQEWRNATSGEGDQ